MTSFGGREDPSVGVVGVRQHPHPGKDKKAASEDPLYYW